MTEKNTLKSSLEVFPFVVQVDENSSGKNINSTNRIIASKDCKIDNLGENLNARVATIENGECLEVTIPEGMEEKAFLSENGIKVIQLVSELGCSKLRIISAKKDVNDTETNNVLNKVFKKSKIEAHDQRSTINNIKSEDTDIEPADDSVFHIAEAIIAKTLDFVDKKLGSNEGNVSGDDVKNEVRSLISGANKSIESMPLSGLPDLLKNKSIAFKRATTKLLAKVCENVFYVIRHDKDIQGCVNDLSKALIDYAKNRTNCSEDGSIGKYKDIITTQENLKKLIGNAGHMESVNKVLGLAFVRAAVDKFYQKLVDLRDPKVLLNIKSTFNRLKKEIRSIESTKEDSQIDFSSHLADLAYGFGFCPSYVDVRLEWLKKVDAKTKSVLRILEELSDEHVLDIGEGKRFEKLNTGSCNDRNCAFRAISVGAGFGLNGYNTIQQKVVEGANWVLENWKNLDEKKKNDISEMLMWHVNTKNMKKHYSGNVKDLLNEYIDCRKKGFVSGVRDIEYLFAAVGLKRPIFDIKYNDSEEAIFFPDCTIEVGKLVRDQKSDDMICVGSIHGHAEALIPLDNEVSQEEGNKFSMPNEKVSEVKKAIANHILCVIYDDINKQNSKLCEILAEDCFIFYEIQGKRVLFDAYEDTVQQGFRRISFAEKFIYRINSKHVECDENVFIAMQILGAVDKKFDESERKNVDNLNEMITKAIRIKARQELADDEEKVLQDNLENFVNIYVDKAVELCKKEPLFWDNVLRLIFPEIKRLFQKDGR